MRKTNARSRVKKWRQSTEPYNKRSRYTKDQWGRRGKF